MAYDGNSIHLNQFESEGDTAVVCSFFGHREAPQSLYPEIKENIEYLIAQRKVDCFMVGNQGNFDCMVLKALRELKQEYPCICYNVVLAYMPTHKQKYELHTPEETVLPEGIETVPRRFAISWRNRWMVKESEIIICYIDHTWGGAVQYIKYAQNQGKEIINLSQKYFEKF